MTIAHPGFQPLPFHAGVDEAGRGPLAGPVVAAAVVLDPKRIPKGIDDSKRLSEKRREALAIEICETALHWAVVPVTAAVIDDINILHATLLAMRNAVIELNVNLSQVLIDGNRSPEFTKDDTQAEIVTWIGGDAANVSIAAASILAKTHRDRLMVGYDKDWPVYEFARHKGYPTAAHLRALQEHGPCDIHRRSFAPVRRALAHREAS
ncbi:MAG: ribonuclease HII [Woeseiaceae bacterium]